MKRFFFLFLSLSLPSLFLAAGCSRSGAAGKAETLADVPLPVLVQEAAEGMFERAVTALGTLESVDAAVVSARIPGPLLRVAVDLGDPVEEGKTVLFEVDPVTVSNQVVIAREAAATARAQVAVAEATLRKAQAVAEKSALDAARFERLHGEARVSDNEWETVRTQHAAAEADVAVAEASLQLTRQQVSQAEAQLAIAERQLSDATVRAPCDGVVNARLKEPGEMVAAGVPVIDIKGTSRLKALAFLPARHFGEVVPGETAVEIAPNGGAAVKAVVSAKSPAIDERLRVFEIKALVEGSASAVPGAMADFRVVFERREGVSVPEDAVLSRAAGTVVFLAQGDGTAKEVPVTVGLEYIQKT